MVSMTSRIFCVVEQEVDELRDLDVVDGIRPRLGSRALSSRKEFLFGHSAVTR